MYPITIIICIFILLFFHQETIQGIHSGLDLWFHTLIPALFPFILLTSLLISSGNVNQCNSHNKTKAILLSLLLGNLCGYPLGAKILSSNVNNNTIDSFTANHFLSIASNLCPIFYIHYVHRTIMQEAIPFTLFIISIYLPVIILTIVKLLIISNHSSKKRIPKNKSAINNNSISNPNYEKTKQPDDSNPNKIKSINLKTSFLQASETMLIIGINVIIFSILITLAKPVLHFRFHNIDIGQLFLSTFEITTGLHFAAKSSIPVGLFPPIIGMLCTMGGICNAIQVNSAIDYTNSSIKKYLLDKCILSASTFFILYLFQ